MTSPVRALPGDNSTEIVRQHIRPFAIAAIAFPDGVEYLSEGPAVTYLSNSYLEGRVAIGGINWQDSAKQTGTLEYLAAQDSNRCEDLMLDYILIDVAVDIYLVHKLVDNSLTTPVLFARGYCSGATLNDRSITMTLEVGRSKNTFVPRRYFSPSEGFNWLPREGSSIFWNGQKHILKGEVSG